MSSDYALLFAPVAEPREVVWEPFVAATRAFGASYLAIATRLQRTHNAPDWYLTTETALASTSAEVLGLMARWPGLALELQSGFGPLKALFWDDGGGRTGVGLFENSYAFSLQSEDPDVRETFAHAAVDMARIIGSDTAMLVGDPSFRTWNRSSLHALLQGPPSVSGEPLVYWAAQRAGPAPDQKHDPAWLTEPIGDFRAFSSPHFIADPDLTA
jgi:hypothetical protein